MGHGCPHHISHIRLRELRYSGYDFTGLYTVNGYSRQPHTGGLARVPAPALLAFIVVGFVQRWNYTTEFD